MAVIWVSVLIVSLTFPDIVIDDGFVEIPFGSIAAPIIGVALTSYVVDFLVTGFAARNAGRLLEDELEPSIAGDPYADLQHEPAYEPERDDEQPTAELEVSYLEDRQGYE